jgi:hypothetical protein
VNRTPRTLCLLAAAVVAGVSHAAAQPRTTQKPAPRPPAAGRKAKGARGAKEGQAAQARARQLAVAALLEAAEAARAVEHAGDRVRLQAEAADALWPLDEQAACSLFRRAWEFTTDPGALEAFRPEEEGGRFGARERILLARHDIISRAAKHDAPLAEGFMQELKRGLPPEAREEEEDAFSSARRGERRQPSPLNLQRLLTAHELLNEGVFEAAAALAAPAVADGPNLPLLRFILRLRAFAPREADALFLRLVAVTRADPAADANDVLLLSTPVVAPEVFALIAPDGSTYLAPVGRVESDPPAATPLAAPARRAFFDAAAAVLLRPAAPRDTAGEALAIFFAAGRLLPFFEREAPQYVAPLRARVSGLTQDLDESRRTAVSSQMHLERLTPRNPPDPLRTQLDAVARATDDAGRDRALFDAASAASLRKLWERARTFAGEIGETRTRRAAFLLIALEQVKHVGEGFREEDEADDFERAAAFARAADVPAGVRAYGLAQAAELAARKGKKKRAAELFDEAVAAAASVDRGSVVRVALLSLLTEAAARSDAARAWGLLTELTAAVNELDGRPASEEGGDDCPGVTVETAENAYCVELAERLPEPEEVFAAVARLDLERALNEARTLKGGYARARSLIHAARAASAVSATRGGGASR